MWRAANLHPGLGYDNFIPVLEWGNAQVLLLTETVLFWRGRVDDRSFLEAGVKAYLMHGFWLPGRLKVGLHVHWAPRTCRITAMDLNRRRHIPANPLGTTTVHRERPCRWSPKKFAGTWRLPQGTTMYVAPGPAEQDDFFTVCPGNQKPWSNGTKPSFLQEEVKTCLRTQFRLLTRQLFSVCNSAHLAVVYINNWKSKDTMLGEVQME